MDINKYKVVLASASPRRKELLEQVGVQFSVRPSECEELIEKDAPEEIVMKLALDKAMDVARCSDFDTLVIGADTVVCAGGEILGKPKDEQAAFDMISMIKNNTHSVFTGVALILHRKKGDILNNFFIETKVSVFDMTDDEIMSYIRTGEPMDKAGAYGIQGCFAEYVEKIDGDYNNVVGLPVSAIMKSIKEMED